MTPSRESDGIRTNSDRGGLTEPPITRQNWDDQAGAWRENPSSARHDSAPSWRETSERARLRGLLGGVVLPGPLRGLLGNVVSGL